MLKNSSGSLFTFFQKFGQSLLVPVAILPAVGMLYGIGMAMTSTTLVAVAPWLLEGPWPTIAAMFSGIGSIVFGNMAILFAVGIAVGLAKKNDGTAGLAAVAGYLVMNVAIQVILGLDAEKIAEDTTLYQSVLGIPSLRTGVFGGIAIGLLAAWAYNRFHTIQVPEYLAFFGAKRFVPIVTTLISILFGAIFCVIWPGISALLTAFSDFVITQNTEIGLFFYGVIVKALNPLGLHNVFCTPFMFQFGTYTSLSGEVVSGDKAMFFAQLADGVPVTAGIFNLGNYAIDTFGMVGIGLAIYKNARPEKKKQTAGILISACLTSFVCGITEPLLFSYLFVAPLCFATYCILNGLCYVTCHILGIRITATFAGGIIDYFLIGVLGGAPKWWLIPIVGIVWGLLFFFIDDFLIRKFNYKTLGREDDGIALGEGSLTLDAKARAAAIIEALGGKANIADITCCVTRLRVQVVDPALVQKDRFAELGAKGVVENGKNFQIIIGTTVQTVLHDVELVLAQ